MIPCILICFRRNPGRRIGDSEIEHFSGRDEVVQCQHEFRDTGAEVPPVDVEDIDIARLQFLERGFQREFQGFGPVAAVVGLDYFAAVVFLVGAGVFGCLEKFSLEIGW